jgi:hypothetical protein
MKCACDKCGAVCDKPGKCGKCDKGVCKMSCKCSKCGKEMKMDGKACPMMKKDCKCPSCGAQCEMKCACDKCGAVSDKPGNAQVRQGRLQDVLQMPKCGKEMKMERV